VWFLLLREAFAPTFRWWPGYAPCFELCASPSAFRRASGFDLFRCQSHGLILRRLALLLADRGRKIAHDEDERGRNLLRLLLVRGFAALVHVAIITHIFTMWDNNCDGEHNLELF